MKSIIHLISILAICTAYPTTESTSNDITNSNNQEIEQLTKELNNAAYKQYFKNALTQYVLTEYKDLTINEKEKINDIIEELLQDLARDFSVISNNVDVDTGVFSTSNCSVTIEELRKRVVSAVPNIDRSKAVKLAYSLEHRILKARQKIDNVIKDSQLAYIHNSEP